MKRKLKAPGILLLAISMMLSLVGCKGTEMSENPGEKIKAEEEFTESAYRAKAISAPSEPAWLSYMELIDGKMYLLGQEKNNSLAVYSAEPGNESWEKTALSPNPIPEHKEGKMPDEFTETTGFSVFEGKFYLMLRKSLIEEDKTVNSLNIYNEEDGLLIESMELPIPETEYISSCKLLSGKLYALGQTASFVYSPEGELINIIEEVPLFISGVKDKVYLGIDRGVKNVLCRLEEDGRELNEICEFPPKENPYIHYSSYKSEKGIFIADENKISALNPESGEITELCRWSDAGLGLTLGPEELYINEENEMYILHGREKLIYKVYPYDGKQREIITVSSGVGIGAVFHADAIAKFNRENEDYMVRQILYSAEDSPRILSEISSGQGPDVLFLGSTASYEMDNPYIRVKVDRNLCEDLMPYIENDQYIKKEDFLPGVLESMTEDGRLYSLHPDFAAYSIAAPEELAEKYENWNMDALFDIASKLPEGYTLCPTSKDEMQRCLNFYSSVRFVDRAKGSCSFDDPDFAKWLELMKNMDYYDWDKSEGYVLEIGSVGNNVPGMCREAFGDYEYVGFPSSEGGIHFINPSTGGFSILSSSENKEAAWEFIKTMVSDQIQKATMGFGYQVIEKNFDEKIQRSRESGNFTEDDGQKLKNIIAESSGIGWGGVIGDIISQEAEKYFADRQSLEDTVKMIQSRVGIFLAEQN